MKKIGDTVIRQKICKNSSMDWAKKLFSSVDDGTVFLADEYRVARGRQGRIWKLYPGQLVGTFVLKPGKKTDAHSSLRYVNMAIVVAIAEVLGSYGVWVKWPNNFMLGEKKAGGMLIEAIWLDGFCGLVVGFSVNVNNIILPDDEMYPIATSLKESCGEEINLEKLQKEIYLVLDEWYGYWKNGVYEKIFSTWRKKLLSLGKKTQVHQKDGTVLLGLAKDVTEDGDLVFIDERGKELIIPFCVIDTLNVKADG